MRRFLVIFGLTLFLFSGFWVLLHRDQIQNPEDLLRLIGRDFSSLRGQISPSLTPFRGRVSSVVRVGSFNANQFGRDKIKDEQASAVMIELISQFDVVALQEVDTSDPFAWKRFVRRLNRSGRKFRLVTGPELHEERELHPAMSRGYPTPSQRLGQTAFLYDMSTIELVDNRAYYVSDPDDLMLQDPLVGWFRVASNDRRSFTFSLVNLQLSSIEPNREIEQIAQIFAAVRADGRMEDDIVMVGDFGITAGHLNQVVNSQGLQAANVDFPTDTQGTAQLDNIVLDPLATSEFTGDVGVLDFLKLHNLTLQQALEISDHLPVWAEFEVMESGPIDQIARERGTQPY